MEGGWNKARKINIAAIPDTRGFTNPYHFSHRSGVVAGASPSAYRRSAEAPRELLLDGGPQRLGALVWTAPGPRRIPS